ncbi:MAG: cytochrome-c peroxidase [Myxococcota bacterium]
MAARCSSSSDESGVCGNGKVEAGELCDDGADNVDGWWLVESCNTSCSGFTRYCGDGTIDPEETCDSGSANNDSWALAEHCNGTCTAVAPFCGDGVRNGGETCDAGVDNAAYALAAEGCNDSCSGEPRYCGDGIIDPEEVCDDGEANNDAWTDVPHCNAECTGQRPLCDLPEPSTAALPYLGVRYPDENRHSTEKMVLGRILFWDEQLSSDNSVACGTCHVPSTGGADPRAGARHPGEDGVLGSSDDPHGSFGIQSCSVDSQGNVTYRRDPVFAGGPKVTQRRAPSFMDAMFANALFWDGRASGEFVDPDTGLPAIVSGGALESQAVMPLTSTSEMACDGQTLSALHAKLRSATPLDLATDIPNDMANAICRYPTYPELFEWAFGDPTINTRRIAFAIATYERTLLSNETPYHRFVAGETDALSDDQQAGLALMQEVNGGGRCARCHIPSQQFGSNRISEIGFKASAWDGGASGIGDFRAVPLMNIGLRAERPMLHDGLAPDDSSAPFASLRAVMGAYNNPPAIGASTDPSIQALGLSTTDLENMIDFMVNGLTDPRAANEEFPFDRPRLSFD